MIKICAWCKRRRINGEWVEDKRSREDYPPFSISDGMCEDCYDANFEKVEDTDHGRS